MFNINNITKAAFFIIVISAPIQWISIVDIGSLSIKWINLSVIPILLCLFFSGFRKTMSDFYKLNRWLVYAFVLLMVFDYIFTCFTLINESVGFSYIAKNLSYLLYFLAFGPIIVYRYRTPKFYREVAICNFACTIFFLCVVEVIFLSLGRNFFSELVTNFLKGNSVAIRYDLFYKLFNAHGSAGDDDYQTSLRNTLLGAFIYIVFTSLYSFKLCKGTFLKLLNIFNIGFGVFLVFASTSRSNMVALFLGYVTYISLSVYSGKFRFKISYILMAMVFLFLCVAFWPIIESVFANSTDMIGDRLAQLDQDARWNLDGEAIVYFFSNPLAGKGAGAVLSDGHRVHNFILGGAYQAGIIGFLLSSVFYFGIVGKFLNSAKSIAKKKELYWFAALVCLPLLRAMTSGNNGTLSIIEWFCLAFYFAVAMEEKNANNAMYLQAIHVQQKESVQLV